MKWVFALPLVDDRRHAGWCFEHKFDYRQLYIVVFKRDHLDRDNTSWVGMSLGGLKIILAVPAV